MFKNFNANVLSRMQTGQRTIANKDEGLLLDIMSAREKPVTEDETF